MREDIEFEAEGDTLRGWLYTPDEYDGPVPTVVMAHGFSAVKEMYLDKYGEAFSEAGLGALVFDNRNFGESDGEPRYEIDPWQQVRDYRHAITYAITRDEVDGDRIGVWGSSYSGGHALTVGALENRVSAVVSQVPVTDGYHNVRRLVRADIMGQFQDQFDQDRLARFQGEDPAMVPVVSEDLMGDAALPTQDSYEWFTETKEERAPNWENQVTLKTVEMLSEYSPIDYIHRISPTPMLMIIAEGDHLAVADKAFEAYEEALEPKKLVTLDGGHFGAYVEEFETSSGAARDWFVEHLVEGQ
ncbi:alpha/beta hydrolase [Haloferax gibbonsii]|uniref:Acetyl xylan esterase n=1 Tax=Haloferax gibbonsii TaxID=35746 RepID=A0A0K1IZU6_HALGI|nr:alpha/beta hydrolase [Haloferax gibbonsii]AKU09820.1 acetyl xylan esterase [Haloferax gibbonsii]